MDMILYHYSTVLSTDLSTHTHKQLHILGVTNCQACDACHIVTHQFAWDASVLTAKLKDNAALSSCRSPCVHEGS